MKTAREKTVLSLVAHPDDAEFMCAGTLALLHQRGWDIHIATMTPGDCGSVRLSREEISRIRTNEAAKSAAILEGAYYCLERDDVFILYDRPTLLKAIRLLREVRPMLVLTMSPTDYMVDHEITSQIAQTACFAAGMVNIQTPGVDPFEPVPHLYYLDPMEGKDKFGAAIKATTIVDITNVMDIKEKMLMCHASQRDWLLEHHGVDEYVLTMKNFAEKRGQEINAKYAEGFRQHLGHAFPQENILKQELQELVHLLH